MNASRTVLVTVTAAAGLAAIGHVAKGGGLDKGLFRIGAGGLVAAAMLSIAAEVSPQVAGSMGWLILTASALVYGGPAFEGISHAIGSGPVPFTNSTNPKDYPVPPRAGAGAGSLSLP